MEESRVLQPKRKKRSERAGKLVRLTTTGGIVFWGMSLLTSLLPIAAQYRAAFSNWSVYTVWIGLIVMGMFNGFLVSYLLLRLNERISEQKFVRFANFIFLSFFGTIFCYNTVDCSNRSVEVR